MEPKSESFWTHIESLQGRTLYTVARNKPFTVEKVTNSEAELTVHDGGRTRKIFRKDLEPFWHRLMLDGILVKSAMKSVYSFNGSLAVALLASVPGVTTATNPITLRY